MDNDLFESRIAAEELPEDGWCRRLVETYVEEVSRRRSLVANTTTASVFGNSDFWSLSSAQDVCAPIGFDENGQFVELRFGDAAQAHHALVGGMTGSGKSNLLHVIIHSFCWRYSPDELELYLLDYKDGLEFSRYTSDGRSWLPHTRLISSHSDPMYALSMFDNIIGNEWVRRDAMFKKHGCGSIKEFRKSCEQRLPRILIIIDEFQRIFEDQLMADTIGARLNTILTRGRAYGTHLILATQTLRALDCVNLQSMLSQLAVRLALSGREGDHILAPGNCAAEKISQPYCIFNDKTGDVSGNKKIVIPFVDFGAGEGGGLNSALRTSIADSADNQFCSACKIFNGAELPLKQSLARDPSGGLEIELGLSNDFEAERIVASFNEDCEGHMLIVVPPKNARDIDSISSKVAIDSIRATIVSSLRMEHDEVEVVYYKANNDDVDLEGMVRRNWRLCLPDSTERELYDALKTLSESKKRHRVLVVDGFEAATIFHQDSADGKSNMRDPEDDDVASCFRGAFAKRDRMPFHVILIMRIGNYRIASNSLGRYSLDYSSNSVDILKHCSMRISVNMSEDIVQELFPEWACSMRRNYKGLLLFGCQDDVRTFLPYKV